MNWIEAVLRWSATVFLFLRFCGENALLAVSNAFSSVLACLLGWSDWLFGHFVLFLGSDISGWYFPATLMFLFNSWVLPGLFTPVIVIVTYWTLSRYIRGKRRPLIPLWVLSAGSFLALCLGALLLFNKRFRQWWNSALPKQAEELKVEARKMSDNVTNLREVADWFSVLPNLSTIAISGAKIFFLVELQEALKRFSDAKIYEDMKTASFWRNAAVTLAIGPTRRWGESDVAFNARCRKNNIDRFMVLVALYVFFGASGKLPEWASLGHFFNWVNRKSMRLPLISGVVDDIPNVVEQKPELARMAGFVSGGILNPDVPEQKEQPKPQPSPVFPGPVIIGDLESDIQAREVLIKRYNTLKSELAIYQQELARDPTQPDAVKAELKDVIRLVQREMAVLLPFVKDSTLPCEHLEVAPYYTLKKFTISYVGDLVARTLNARIIPVQLEHRPGVDPAPVPNLNLPPPPLPTVHEPVVRNEVARQLAPLPEHPLDAHVVPRVAPPATQESPEAKELKELKQQFNELKQQVTAKASPRSLAKPAEADTEEVKALKAALRTANNKLSRKDRKKAAAPKPTNEAAIPVQTQNRFDGLEVEEGDDETSSDIPPMAVEAGKGKTKHGRGRFHKAAEIKITRNHGAKKYDDDRNRESPRDAFDSDEKPSRRAQKRQIAAMRHNRDEEFPDLARGLVRDSDNRAGGPLAPQVSMTLRGARSKREPQSEPEPKQAPGNAWSRGRPKMESKNEVSSDGDCADDDADRLSEHFEAKVQDAPKAFSGYQMHKHIGVIVVGDEQVGFASNCRGKLITCAHVVGVARQQSELTQKPVELFVFGSGRYVLPNKWRIDENRDLADCEVPLKDIATKPTPVLQSLAMSTERPKGGLTLASPPVGWKFDPILAWEYHITPITQYRHSDDTLLGTYRVDTQPGFSGLPVFDHYGSVVGVHRCAKADKDGSNGYTRFDEEFASRLNLKRLPTQSGSIPSAGVSSAGMAN